MLICLCTGTQWWLAKLLPMSSNRRSAPSVWTRFQLLYFYLCIVVCSGLCMRCYVCLRFKLLLLLMLLDLLFDFSAIGVWCISVLRCLIPMWEWSWGFEYTESVLFSFIVFVYVRVSTDSTVMYFDWLIQMLVDDIGDVTITNDGATILKMLEVEHPAAKVGFNFLLLWVLLHFFGNKHLRVSCNVCC